MSFTEQEVSYYHDIVAKIMNNDPVRKTVLDGFARLQLAAVKEALPGADDDTVVTFLVSIAVAVGRLLATPLADAPEVGRGIFDNNMIAAASVMGAYDFDNPDVPEYVPPKSSEETAAAAKTAEDEEIDRIISRAYL